MDHQSADSALDANPNHPERPRPGPSYSTNAQRFRRGQTPEAFEDFVATEEPMEIRIIHRRLPDKGHLVDASRGFVGFPFRRSFVARPHYTLGIREAPIPVQVRTSLRASSSISSTEYPRSSSRIGAVYWWSSGAGPAGGMGAPSKRHGRLG